MLDIALHRLHSQHLLDARFKRPEEVVSWFGAVQSQEYASAKWALAQRLENKADIEIEAAFAQGAILRTHLMRPTWHFVSPLDIRWILELTAPRVKAALASPFRKAGLDSETISRSRVVLEKALEGEHALTRAEIRVAMEQAGIPGLDQRLPFLLMHGELDGLICSGPRQGKQITYALLAERAPQARTLEREEAVAELVRRYFTSHGPATLQDFAWWSGLTIADARAGLQASPSQFDQEVVAGKTYWFAGPHPASAGPSLAVHLLPDFDEYTVGYTDRRAILDGRSAGMVDPRSLVLLSNIILVNGKIAGAWKRTLGKGAVVLAVTPFAPWAPAEERALARTAQRYADFLGLPLVLA